MATEYFSLSSVDAGGSVEYQLPYGEWIGVFRQHGFTVASLKDSFERLKFGHVRT